MFQLGDKLRKMHFYRVTSLWQEMKAFRPVISQITGSWIEFSFSPRHKFQCFSSPFSSRDPAFGRKDKDKITGTFDTNHKNRQGLDWRQSRSLTPNTYLPTAFPSQLDYE